MKEKYELQSGVPAQVNAFLRQGEIDAGPASSIEYLRRPDHYTLIEGHSISSRGPVQSILLFSRVPLDALNNTTVLTSCQSETSSALLVVMLKEFYSLDVHTESSCISLEEGLARYPAYLLIGDDALVTGFGTRKIRMVQELYCYDLGALWHEHTGLPFVYALWIMRRNSPASSLIEALKADLDRVKGQALADLDSLALSSPYLDRISGGTLAAYWRIISYNLDEEHLKGLHLFEEYLRKWKVL